MVNIKVDVKNMSLTSLSLSLEVEILQLCISSCRILEDSAFINSSKFSFNKIITSETIFKFFVEDTPAEIKLLKL